MSASTNMVASLAFSPKKIEQSPMLPKTEPGPAFGVLPQGLANATTVCLASLQGINTAKVLKKRDFSCNTVVILLFRRLGKRHQSTFIGTGLIGFAFKQECSLGNTTLISIDSKSRGRGFHHDSFREIFLRESGVLPKCRYEPIPCSSMGLLSSVV